jgi:hypothetical protein
MFHEMATKVTGLDFVLWGYIKDRVYVPPLPRDAQELKQRIQEAATMVTGCAGKGMARVRFPCGHLTSHTWFPHRFCDAM